MATSVSELLYPCYFTLLTLLLSYIHASYVHTFIMCTVVRQKGLNLRYRESLVGQGTVNAE